MATKVTQPKVKAKPEPPTISPDLVAPITAKVEQAEDTEKLGSLVTRWRMYRGLTQVEFSEKLGITASYLSRIETNERRPSIEILRDIGNVLGIPYEDVLAASGLVTAKMMETMAPKPEERTGALGIMIKYIKSLPKESTRDDILAALCGVTIEEMV